MSSKIKALKPFDLKRSDYPQNSCTIQVCYSNADVVCYINQGMAQKIKVISGPNLGRIHIHQQQNEKENLPQPNRAPDSESKVKG